MATKKTTKKSNVLDLAREILRRRPEATYAEIRDAAAKKGMTIYPISYGRAKALEGLVKISPYGSKKKAGKTAGSGRAPRKAGRRRASGPSSGLEGLVATIENLQRERDEAVEALAEIRAILARV